VKVHTHIKTHAITAELYFLDQEFLAVHGAGAAIYQVDAGAHPFEIRRHHAIDYRSDRAAGLNLHFRQVDTQDRA
jgi:hypothetical protein